MMNDFSSMFGGHMWSSWFMGPFGVVFPLIGIALLIFQIYVLVDCIKHEKANKLIWILVILLINPIGAILYYFMEMRKREGRTHS